MLSRFYCVRLDPVHGLEASAGSLWLVSFALNLHKHGCAPMPELGDFSQAHHFSSLTQAEEFADAVSDYWRGYYVCTVLACASPVICYQSASGSPL